MILEEATYEAYGYYPGELKSRSNKPILVTCEQCGAFRRTTKDLYRTFCRSCSNLLGEKSKGTKHPLFNKHLSDETKVKISKAGKGKFKSEKTKALMSKNHVDVSGEKSHFYKGGPIICIYEQCGKEFPVKQNRIKKGLGKFCSHKCQMKSRWLGGKKVSWAKSHAKRKRDLGYTFLISLAEGEVGHHVTNEYVIGIPEDVHIRFSGGGREKHRAKVLEWLKVNNKKKYKIAVEVLNKEK